MNDTTLKFYEANSEKYTADKNAPNPRLFTFLKQCKLNGRVLELGTGRGVDAAVIIKNDFKLDATDGSSELAAIASLRIGQPVKTMLFNELDAKDV
ncbi:hypothetical protein [Agrobacterium larrymoorei]|uniref:hypothetical protein n=1 Tax=Agrobacterium larrymoorei TaxID=160699 RepID=UPI001F4725B8|nr:hypothetical protein [Agrobacterium larrymoorei]